MMRALVLASIVSLILPPGWCCSFPAPKNVRRFAKVATCPHCCGNAESPAPAKSSCPVPEKSPASCCGPRDATITVKASQPERSLPAATVSIELAAVPNGTDEAATDSAVRTAGPPLYLLNCVWRC